MPDERCSFCGKAHRDVRKLIAGPAVWICDECIDLCNDVLSEELETWRSATLLDVGLVSPGAWARFWDAAAQAAVIGIFQDLVVHRVIRGAESQAFCRALDILPPEEP